MAAAPEDDKAMASACLTNDQATELLLLRLDELKQLAKQIGEGAAVAQVETAIDDALRGVIERYHARKFAELESRVFPRMVSRDRGGRLNA